MAYKPALRAKVAAAIMSGATTWEGARDLAEKESGNRPSKATIKEWLDEARGHVAAPNRNRTEPNSRARNRAGDAPTIADDRAPVRDFDGALDATLMDVMSMLRAWARKASDPDFIETHTHGAIELGKEVFDRSSKLARFRAGDRSGEE